MTSNQAQVDQTQNNPSTSGTPEFGAWWQNLGLWLAGTVCFSLSQGHFPAPMLSVIGIACWIWFFRHSNLLLAILMLIAGNMICWEVAYREMVPLPTVARVGLEFGVSTLFALLFVVDRLALRRLKGKWPTWLLSLVFPAGWVAFDVLNARVSPGATWASIAYSFVDQSPLVHVASLVGWTGLTFLVGWYASLICTLFEKRLPKRQRHAAVGCGVIVAIALMIYGTQRSHSGDNDLAVSLIAAPSTFSAGENFNELWQYTRGVEQPQDDVILAQQQIEKSRQQHFDLVRQEAEFGSQLIAWAEVNATITSEEEAAWIETASQIAKEHQVYVGIGYMVFLTDGELRSRNMFVLVGPDGKVMVNFLKRTRPPGVSHEIGSGPIPLVETQFGKWTTAICYDMDFPQIIGQTGGRADLILAPSNDWTAAAATHQRMAHLRAVENGCCLVRPTKDGISSIADSCGQSVAMQVTDGVPSSVLRGRISVGRSWALYPLIGDSFAWACSLFWLMTVASLVVRRPSQQKVNED